MPHLPDLGDLDPVILVWVAVALVLVQTALVVGFLVPGGKSVVLGGVVAGLGHVPVAVVYTGVLAAALLGATIGFHLGRWQGERLFELRLLRRHQDRLDRVRALLRERSGLALVGGRSIAVLRATTPALAGASGLGVRRFQLWNVIGGAVWAGLLVGLGYLGGSTVPGAAEAAPKVVLVLGTALVVVVVAGGLVRRRLAPSGA